MAFDDKSTSSESNLDISGAKLMQSTYGPHPSRLVSLCESACPAVNIMPEEYFSLSKQSPAMAFNVLNLCLIVKNRFLTDSALHLSRAGSFAEDNKNPRRITISPSWFDHVALQFKRSFAITAQLVSIIEQMVMLFHSENVK